MNDYAYYNGIITPYDSMTIPLTDRALFFGEAIYEVMIGANGNIYQFSEHIARLKKGLNAIDLEVPEDSEILEHCREIIYLSGYSTYIIYMQVSGGGKRRQHLRGERKSNLLITVTSYTPPNEPEPADIITLDDMRYQYCHIKTTNLLPAVLSLNEAKRQAADTSLFIKDGYITECANANIALLKNKVMLTPPLSRMILPGITRENLRAACNTIGIEFAERNISEHELYLADSILITSTTHFIKYCRYINGQKCIHNEIELVKTLFNNMRSSFLS